MELVTLASGQVIRIFTGWRSVLVMVAFSAFVICCWEFGKAIGRARRCPTI